MQGLKHKYSGLEGDKTAKHANIVYRTGRFGLLTLCFTDRKRKRYKATVDKFSVYGKLSPVISRWLGADQVLVGDFGSMEG